MSDYTISDKDVEEAAQLLRDVLTTRSAQRGVSADFSEQSILGGTVVDGHATAFALLRTQLATVQNRLSLRDIEKLPDSEGVRDAADAILSNLFCTRDAGRFARGVATLHFSQRVDSLLPRRVRFFKTSQLVYYISGDADILIRAGDLRPNIDASGRVIDYSITVNLVAARVGVAYNQKKGRFLAVDRFSPYLTYAENLEDFAYGDDKQTTAAFIASANNAMSLRALVNARSNDALLRGQLYPEIQQLLTVSYGDPEMQRDLALDPASGVSLHVGGHVDIFTKLQTQTVVERLVVGDLFARPDNLINILRDPTPPSGSFIAAGVKPGDVLVIAAGLPSAPFQYVIRAVRALELEVAPRTPFDVATDEMSSPSSIEYSIGNNYPAFDNKGTNGPSTSITTSRKISETNRVMLSGGPVYRVKQIEVLNAPSPLDPFRDLVTGNVLFTERTNTAVATTPTNGSTLKYRLICKNPEASQSMEAVNMLEIGWPAYDFAGLTVEVTYETVAGFSPISAYVEDNFNRTNGANPLVRAQHPIYLTFSMPYRPRIIPRNSLDVFTSTGATLPDVPTVVQALVDTIAATPFGTRPDTGGLGQTARDTDSNIAATFPFTIYYDLLAPDGRVFHFATEDIVTVAPDGTSSTARLLNGSDFGLPSTNYYAALTRLLLSMGVSDRTIRYLSDADQITLEQRSV